MVQFVFENKDGAFGYSALNGMGIDEKLIRKYSLKEGDTSVLASDGYPEVCTTLEESEQVLTDILREHPMCFRRYKITKGVKNENVSYADRVYCQGVLLEKVIAYMLIMC